MTSQRRFPPPWRVEQTPGGFKVVDANGQALVLRPARARHATRPTLLAGGLPSVTTAQFVVASRRVRHSVLR